MKATRAQILASLRACHEASRASPDGSATRRLYLDLYGILIAELESAEGES